MTIKIKSDSTTTTLSAWASIVPSAMSAANVATALTDGKVGVGAGCWAVRVGDLVFYKNAAGDAFTKSAAVAGLTTPVFDSSLNFAYAGGKVYQYTTTDYVEIFSVTGLKSTVQLFASQDKKKVILLSYEPTAVGASTYVTVLKAYNVGTAWTAMTLPSAMSSFTTVSGIPTAITELTMETFGVWYDIQDGSSFKPLIILAKPDYVASTVSLYEIPS